METGIPVVVGIVTVALLVARTVARRSNVVTENRFLPRSERCRWCGAARRLHTTDEYMEIDGLRVRRRASVDPCVAQVQRIVSAREWRAERGKA